MRVYIVTVDGKVNSEAFASLQGAREFVLSRVDTVTEEELSRPYLDLKNKAGLRYMITDVLVKGGL